MRKKTNNILKTNWDKKKVFMSIGEKLHLTDFSFSSIPTILFALVLLFTPVILSAQSATAVLKEKEYKIGDWVPIDLYVEATTNARVAFPNFKDSISETIEVANFTPVDTVKKSGMNQYHQLVNLIVFDTGKIALPQFQFLIDNNGKIDSITTSSELIHVAGVAIDTTKDIKPIKEPLKIPLTFKEVLPYIIGALVFALIAAILAWYFIEKRNKVKPIDEKYLLPPHVWAFQQLQKLDNKKLWQTGGVKEYYSELTDIARTYIELRYKIPAMEQTTEELMTALHKGVLKQNLKKDLNDVLTLSDFVKFAKAQPDMLENENAMKVVADFIDKTKLIEEENKEKGIKNKNTTKP